MEVEVVLGEVGEDRRAEMDPVHAPQLQRVRGDLHRASPIARVQHRAERALQVDRLGRGAHDGTLLAAHDRLHGAQQAAAPAGGLERLADQERRRGLPARAGDPDHLERRGGVAEEALGGVRHGGARVGHHHLGHRQVEAALHDQGRGAARDGVGREVVPVTGEPRNAKKERAPRHAPVVVRQLRDLHVAGAFAEQLAKGHAGAV
jgi:hypothetical protein